MCLEIDEIMGLVLWPLIDLVVWSDDIEIIFIYTFFLLPFQDLYLDLVLSSFCSVLLHSIISMIVCIWQVSQQMYVTNSFYYILLYK